MLGCCGALSENIGSWVKGERDQEMTARGNASFKGRVGKTEKENKRGEPEEGLQNGGCTIYETPPPQIG